MLPIVVLLALAVVLFLQTQATPADLQCHGKKQKDGNFHYNLSRDITEEIQDISCEIQWLIDGKVTALFDDNGHADYVFPVKHATVKTATMGFCSDKLRYTLNCPTSSVQKELLCFCETSDAATRAEGWLRLAAVVVGYWILDLF